MERRSGGAEFRSIAGAAALSIGAAALLFRRVLFAGESLYGRDIAPFFYPMKQYLAARVRAGEFPLWNPFVLNGEPFFASLQPGVLYPPSALLYTLQFPFAFDLLVFFHFPLSGVGAFLLLRRWGRGHWASAVGSLAWMLGGYLVSLGNFPNNLQTVAWVPWLFLCWDRFLYTGEAKELLWFVLLCGVAFLGGEPQMLALALLVMFVHGMLKLEGRALSAARQATAFFVAGVLALGLVAFQLLPFVEYAGESIRTLDLDLQYSARRSLDLPGMLHLVIPPVLEAGAHGFTTKFLLGRDVPWLLSVYPGAVVLGLATVGALSSPSGRTVAFWVVCAALGILVALGPHGYLYGFLHGAVPLVRPFRYPEKFVFLAALALSVLAAYGTDHVLDPDRRRLRALGVLWAFALLYLGVVFVLWLRPELLGRLCGSGLASRLCDTPAEAQLLYRQALLLPASAMLVAAAAVSIAWRQAAILRPATVGALLVTVVLLDLAAAHGAVTPSVDRSLYERTPWPASALEEIEPELDRFRYRAIPLSSTMGDIFEVKGAWELSNVYLMHEAMGANRGQMHRMLQQDGLQGVELRSVAYTIDEGLRAKGARATNFLRAFSVRYNVDATGHTGGLPGVEALATHPDLPLTLYRIPDVLPRAYLVGGYRVETDARRALSMAIDPEFSLAEEVVLDRAPLLQPVGNSTNSIIEARFDEEELSFRVLAEAPTLLVVTDRHYPGWVAEVDGHPAELLRANGFFRAVAVPAGNHVVRLEFSPRSFRIGAWISALAAITWLTAAAFSFRSRTT